jgi:8-oxo-dGTP diphosphatase
LNILVKSPRLAIDCVIFNKNNVILIRRKHGPFKGYYALPGGFVEFGESLEEACVREIKEETNLQLNIKNLKLINVYSDLERDPRGHVVSIAFLGKSNIENLSAGDDASSVKLVEDWRSRDIAFDHKKILEDAYKIYKNTECN